MSCNCNNMGSSCSGCGSGAVMIATMQQGDTFPVYSKPYNDEEIKLLDNGWDYIMCFRDYKGNLLLKASLKGGRITVDGTMYVLRVEHAESMKMLGKVYVETTVTSDNESNVYHGDRIFTMQFEPRKNNEIIPGGDTPAPEPTPQVEIATEEEIDAITEDWQ